MSCFPCLLKNITFNTDRIRINISLKINKPLVSKLLHHLLENVKYWLTVHRVLYLMLDADVR